LLGFLEEKPQEDTVKATLFDLLKLFGLHSVDFVDTYFSYKLNTEAHKSVVEYFLSPDNQKKNNTAIYKLEMLTCLVDYHLT
jgi:hypothetical protein